MDVFADFSIDAFKYLIWILALVVAALFALSYPRTRARQVIGLVLKSALGAAVAFFAASLAVVFYILAHPTDQRWSAGKDAVVKSPELSAGVPLFDGIVNSLNQFMSTMTGSVNDVLAIKNAFLSTTDFLLMAGWGLVAIVALGVPVWIIGILDERWRKRQLDAVIDANARHTKDLADIRESLHLPAFSPRK
jgi:hypothetical protein